MSAPEPDAPSTITVSSPAFVDGQRIPREYTCRGPGTVPELAWRSIPAAAASLALVVTDPDAPRGTFIHWLLYDLPPGDGGLAPGRLPSGAKEGENSAGRTGWFPPCPPSGSHRYVFTLYALREPASGRSTREILDSIDRTAVARGTLTGLVPAG